MAVIKQKAGGTPHPRKAFGTHEPHGRRGQKSRQAGNRTFDMLGEFLARHGIQLIPSDLEHRVRQAGRHLEPPQPRRAVAAEGPPRAQAVAGRQDQTAGRTRAST